MKRIVSLLIVISIGLMFCAPVFAAGESSPIPVTLTAYCELKGTACDIEKISGIYLDNNFYVEPETLASITGYFVEEKSERGVRLLSHNGIRPSVVILSEEDCIETYIGDDTIITPCPVQLFDKKPYVSFVHFMKYVGVSFAFYENQPIQLITIKHYDIFDAMGDMMASDGGYRFTWDEIDYGKDIDDILFNAGLVAILGEGIDPIKTVLNPDSIHEGILENVLLTIVSTDCGSSTYLSNSSYQVLYDAEGLATLAGSYPDYLEVYSQNVPSGGSAKLVESAIGITSLAADTIVNVMEGIELSQRYDALIDQERTILQDTIVRFSSQLSDIVMENNDDFKYIINTATDVSVKAQDNAERSASIRNEIFKDLAIDGTSLALGIFDPFTTAINGAMSIYKILPGTSGIIDKKTMLWNAYCSSVVQDLAFSIYANHNMTWYQWDKVQEAVEKIQTSDSLIGKLFSDYQMMGREDLLMYLKKAMLLQLRSTFITRQYLIASGSLDENAVNIQNEVCSYISELYYKISSCTIPEYNPDNLSTTPDLSWMNADDTSDDFERHIEQLKRDYGEIFPQQFSNIHKAGEATDMTTNGWTAGTGVLNSVVHDLDRDGENELLVVLIQEKDASSNSREHTIVYPELVVFENCAGTIVEASRMSLDTLHPTNPNVASIDYNNSLCGLTSFYIHTTSDKTYICTERYEYAVFADGYDYGYFFFEYDGNRLGLSRYTYKPPASGVEDLYYGIKKENGYQEKLAYSDYPDNRNAEYTGKDPVQWIMRKLGVKDESETDLYLNRHLTWKNSVNSILLSEIRITASPNQSSWFEQEFTYLVLQGSSISVLFEHNNLWSEGVDKEYGIFVATDRFGKELWRYSTVDHRHTELRGFGEIGIENGMYYLYDNGHVITLDLQTGSEIWQCPFIGGNASFDFDDAGTLYICGRYGPDLAIIDKTGKLLKQIDSFDPNYYWADEIVCLQSEVVVNLSNGPDGYKEKCYTCVVTLPDYSYKMLSNRTEEPHDPSNLIQNTAIDQYRAVLQTHPTTRSGYATKYTLHDIDKNGIPELIVQENVSEYFTYTFNDTEVIASEKNFWWYSNCLYVYDGNGIIVHDGGMGQLRIENIHLYSMTNNKLQFSEGLMTTENCSFDELYSYLNTLTPINDFHEITDLSYLNSYASSLEETQEASHTYDEAETLLYEYLAQKYGFDGLSVMQVIPYGSQETQLQMTISEEDGPIYIIEWYRVDLETGEVRNANNNNFTCDLW